MPRFQRQPSNPEFSRTSSSGDGRPGTRPVSRRIVRHDRLPRGSQGKHTERYCQPSHGYCGCCPWGKLTKTKGALRVGFPPPGSSLPRRPGAWAVLKPGLGAMGR
jgi:hypothetical protein